MTERRRLTDVPTMATTTVGSYAGIDWLQQAGTEQAVSDATSVVFSTQQRAGIDLPTDGELYRFDVNHPDTNGMIEYFISRIGGIDTRIGRSDTATFTKKNEMAFRSKPAGVVRDALHEGVLDLESACARSAAVTTGRFKFTLTSPFMLARTLLDDHYQDLESLTMAIAQVLAAQVSDLPCDCVQIDEANIPGCPEFAPIAQAGINCILDAIPVERAVHFCFGNYGGQAIQDGTWKALTTFLNGLHTDHLILELAHRPDADLYALQDIDPHIGLGLGVIDIKVNAVESADTVARRIEKAASVLGAERIRWLHPDCGLWMLKRSVADRKLQALVAGRNQFIGTAAAALA